MNTRFAALIAGDVPAAKPLPPEFVERPWAEIAAAIPGKLEAATAATPPPGVTRHDAIAALDRASKNGETANTVLAAIIGTVTAPAGVVGNPAAW